MMYIPKEFPQLSTVNICKREEKDMVEVDYGPTLDILKKEYLDVYEGIQSEIVNTTRFDENSD